VRASLDAWLFAGVGGVVGGVEIGTPPRDPGPQGVLPSGLATHENLHPTLTFRS